jgi:hypothetical protein
MRVTAYGRTVDRLNARPFDARNYPPVPFINPRML